MCQDMRQAVSAMVTTPSHATLWWSKLWSFVQGDMHQNIRRFACSSLEHLAWVVCAKICAAMPADKNEANNCFTRHPSEKSLYQVFARGQIIKAPHEPL